jgi:hypothetical protein
MGAIYEQARVTIAAADALDSTEGCFISDRPDLPPISVQSKGMDGLPVTVHFAAVPWQNHNPYYSPLGHRAWACQEWYLSRRVIFCTEGGFSWKCKVDQFNERQIYCDMNEREEWERLLQRYSESKLTYETDRLIALQGVANQMSGTRSDQYRFGVWTDDLPELLFWMIRVPEPDLKGPEMVPSWSWASRAGAKFFWKTMIQFFNGPTNLARNGIDVKEDGALTTRAPVLTIQTSPVPSAWADAGKEGPPKQRHSAPWETAAPPYPRWLKLSSRSRIRRPTSSPSTTTWPVSGQEERRRQT